MAPASTSSSSIAGEGVWYDATMGEVVQAWTAKLRAPIDKLCAAQRHMRSASSCGVGVRCLRQVGQGSVAASMSVRSVPLSKRTLWGTEETYRRLRALRQVPMAVAGRAASCRRPLASVRCSPTLRQGISQQTKYGGPEGDSGSYMLTLRLVGALLSPFEVPYRREKLEARRSARCGPLRRRRQHTNSGEPILLLEHDGDTYSVIMALMPLRRSCRLHGVVEGAARATPPHRRRCGQRCKSLRKLRKAVAEVIEPAEKPLRGPRAYWSWSRRVGVRAEVAGRETQEGEPHLERRSGA